MKIKCIKCQAQFRRSDKYHKAIVKFGSYYRTSDRKHVQRFFCRMCKTHFSVATLSVCYRQKKRTLNSRVARELVAGVSQRECQRILKINRKTVVRKFIFMAECAKINLAKLNLNRPKVTTFEFDDMETFEHSKCKPLSITLVVENKTRWILGHEVAQMPAKGLLTKISLKKYGNRNDHRPEASVKLFNKIGNYIKPEALIKSDECPHYLGDVRRFFPKAQHKRYKGRKGCIVGQGELKKIGFDPLFSLNHTCAVLRARVNRLIRRTWCTTKKKERLSLHIALVTLHHNLSLNLPSLSTASWASLLITQLHKDAF